MPDWFDCYDPHELRRLLGEADAKIAALSDRVELLQMQLNGHRDPRAGKAADAIVGTLTAPALRPSESILPRVDRESTTKDKVALFRELLWEAATGTPIGEPLTGHTGEVTALAFATTADGTLVLASGSHDTSVRL
ncbi:hypothetical protein [Nocardia sp. NPDC059239]|uniref:hypothetical protein n=1 Tax=Nocardia sp. NPDC059239 TaxID=3346785 RepID=UPI0036B68FEE